MFYPNLSKVKNGLTPGTNYRVMWRTWCNSLQVAKSVITDHHSGMGQ